MKKVFFILFAVFVSTNVFSASVLDNNTGTKGDILIHSGEYTGKNNVGEWVSSETFKGEKGDTGKNGLNGVDGKDGLNGTNGIDGDKGDKGDVGKRGIRGEKGKGLQDRHEVMCEVRLLDTKRTTFSAYFGHDVNNNNNIVGLKLAVKIGKSYEEKRIDELEKKISSLLEESLR